MALQSYLDGLLQEATQELLWVEPEPEPIAPLPVAEPVELDDFAAAVLEEQVRDAVPLRTPEVVPAEIAQVVDTQGAVAQRYDLQPGSCYLLRPDQHVAARWRQFDAAKVRAALARATGNA